MIFVLTPLPKEILSTEPVEKLVTLKYHDFLLLFFKKEASILPLYHYVDHEIHLLPSVKSPLGRMYSMSGSELREV